MRTGRNTGASVRPWDILGPTVRLYHGSYLGNASSLLEKGVIPRRQLLDCNKFVDGVLSDYGVTRADLPAWTWGYALERCQDTAKVVYLSADYAYALGNSLAGFEAEDSLRHIIAKELGLPGYIPPDRDSVMCAVDVPTRVLFSPDVETGSYGNEREEIFFRCFAEMPRLFKDTDHILRTMFRVATFDKIPASWIKSCWSAKRPEFRTKR